MKTAIVYDRVNKWGGAERVLLTLHKMFPDAPLYTSLYDPKGASWAKAFPEVCTSFLQKISFLRKRHTLVGYLMPIAFESLNFDNFDLVISVTSEAAKGIITKPHTRHICYMLTPTRYLWSGYEEYFKNVILKILSKPVVSYLRKWDKIASNRPDQIISISNEVRNRVKNIYNINSEVIFPSTTLDSGIDTTKNGEYYLVVSRLVPYKKVSIVIEAFNKLKYPLVIVGSGSEKERLISSSKSRDTRFVGDVTDKQLIDLYSNCKALIFPQVEDFGLTSVEVQTFGKPVIAYRNGGALDTVIDGKTGLFFNEQIWQAVYDAVLRFEKMNFDKNVIKSNASRFSENKFKNSFLDLLKR